MLIGGDSLALRRSGIGRMTLEIARAARLDPAIAHVTLLMADKMVDSALVDALSDDEAGGGGPASWKVMLWRVPGVPTLLRLRHGRLSRRVRDLAAATPGPLVYHEPNMIARPVRLPTVVTMNDLSWHYEPSWHPAERIRWIHRNLSRTLRQASRFAAISQFTKDVVVRDLGVAADRIDVIPLAPAAGFRAMPFAEAQPVLARYGLDDRGYVFSTSTLEPRKNFDRLLAAHLQLPPPLRVRAPLVIAGGKGWGDVLARADARSAVADGSVRLLGHVPDTDLAALCARAGVFAYPSLYEGFGLPVIEAMAAGCPVVASSTTAVGEIAAGAAVLVDPLDVPSIAEGLRQVLEDPALATQLIAQGQARAAEYTWQRTVAVLTGCWRRALAA